jgi:hypothetical protein
MPLANTLFDSVFPSTLNLKVSQDEQCPEMKVSSGVDSMISSDFFMLHRFPHAESDCDPVVTAETCRTCRMAQNNRIFRLVSRSTKVRSKLQPGTVN